MNPARRHELELRLAVAIDRNVVEAGEPAMLLAAAVVSLVEDRDAEEALALAAELGIVGAKYPRKGPG